VDELLDAVEAAAGGHERVEAGGGVAEGAARHPRHPFGLV